VFVQSIVISHQLQQKKEKEWPKKASAANT